MDNECLYLCSTASTLSMGDLKCITYLLLLLCLLRFIINAHNKCVTLALIVINGNDDPRLFFWLISCPLLVFLSLRRDKNITVCRFVFRVRRIYCELMFRLLRDTCTIRMSPSCQFISIFLHDLLFILFFPSLSFFPFSFHFFSLHAISFAWSSFSSSESFLINSFLFLVSLFELPFLFLCSCGRSFLSLVGLPFYFFLFCSSMWSAWVCR